MTTAVGLKAMSKHLCSYFTEWMVSELIVEEDVGKENVGHAPNPRPSPGVHYTYVPGTFVGGIPSPQWELTKRYRRLHTGMERLVSFSCH